MLKRLYTHTQNYKRKLQYPKLPLEVLRELHYSTTVLLFIHFTDVDILVEVTGRQAGRGREINWLTQTNTLTKQIIGSRDEAFKNMWV